MKCKSRDQRLQPRFNRVFCKNRMNVGDRLAGRFGSDFWRAELQGSKQNSVYHQISSLSHLSQDVDSTYLSLERVDDFAYNRSSTTRGHQVSAHGHACIVLSLVPYFKLCCLYGSLLSMILIIVGDYMSTCLHRAGCRRYTAVLAAG